MTHGGGERREANPFLPSDGSYYWDVAGYTVLYCITGVLHLRMMLVMIWKEKNKRRNKMA